MSHPIYRVISFEVEAPYTLRIRFDDETEQVIDFQDVLEGELFGPLRDPSLFEQVRIDPEVHTLIWPNGADFDPATLHDWPVQLPELKKLAERWSRAQGIDAPLRWSWKIGQVAKVYSTDLGRDTQ